jgi:hypothetical protein
MHHAPTTAHVVTVSLNHHVTAHGLGYGTTANKNGHSTRCGQESQIDTHKHEYLGTLRPARCKRLHYRAPRRSSGTLAQPAPPGRAQTPSGIRHTLQYPLCGPPREIGDFLASRPTAGPSIRGE